MTRVYCQFIWCFAIFPMCVYFCCCSHACIIIPNISTSTFINSFLCVKEVMKNVYFIFNLCNLYFLSSKIPGRKNTNVGMHTLFRSVNNFLQKKSFAFQVPKKKGQYFLFYVLSFCTDENDAFDMTLRLRWTYQIQYVLKICQKKNLISLNLILISIIILALVFFSVKNISRLIKTAIAYLLWNREKENMLPGQNDDS